MNAVNKITASLATAIAERGKASFVVPGGSSPFGIFSALVNGDYSAFVNWSKVTITLVDDRLVPNDHQDSNHKLIRSQLLVGPVAAAQLLPLTADGFDKKIDLPFDVMLLGMGSDGHFASLFPSMVGKAAMTLSTVPAIIETGPQGNPLWPRISMNLSMILRSRLVVLLVRGPGKKDVLDAAKTDRSLPVHHLISQTVKSVQIVTD